MPHSFISLTAVSITSVTRPLRAARSYTSSWSWQASTAQAMRIRLPPSLSLLPAAPPSRRKTASASLVKLYTCMSPARWGPASRSMAFSVSKEYCSGTSSTPPSRPFTARSASIRRMVSVLPLPARPSTNRSTSLSPSL